MDINYYKKEKSFGGGCKSNGNALCKKSISPFLRVFAFRNEKTQFWKKSLVGALKG